MGNSVSSGVMQPSVQIPPLPFASSVVPDRWPESLSSLVASVERGGGFNPSGWNETVYVSTGVRGTGTLEHGNYCNHGGGISREVRIGCVPKHRRVTSEKFLECELEMPKVLGTQTPI